MGQYFQLLAQPVFLQATPAHPVPRDGELRRGTAARRPAGEGARGGAGIGRGCLGASQAHHEAAAPEPRAGVPETSVPVFRGGRQARQGELRRRAGRHGCAWPSAAPAVGGAGDGGHPHAADGGRCAGQLRRVADGQSAGEPQLHIVVGGAGFVHRAVQYPHGGHVESVPRADQARRAGGDGFAGGRRQIDRRRQQTRRRPGLSAVAGWPVGEVSRQQTQGVDGRLGHGHFLERQHRRAQGRDALALQRRLEYPADWPSVCAGSTRSHPRHPAVFPLVRFHRYAVAPAAARLGRGVSPKPGRWPRHRRAGGRAPGNVSAGHTDIPADLHPRLHAGTVWQRGVCPGRRGEIVGAPGHGVRGSLRAATDGGLRHD